MKGVIKDLLQFSHEVYPSIRILDESLRKKFSAQLHQSPQFMISIREGEIESITESRYVEIMKLSLDSEPLSISSFKRMILQSDVEKFDTFLRTVASRGYEEIVISFMFGSFGGARFQFSLSGLRLDIDHFILTFVDISEERMSQIMMAQTEHSYLNVFAKSPFGMAVHNGVNVLYLNETALKIMGMKSTLDFKDVELLDFVHPDDQQKVLERIRLALLQNISTEVLHERFLKLNGEVIHVEVSSIPITYRGEHCVLVMFRDVSDRVRQEKELRSNKDRFSDLFYNLPLPQVILNSNGNITQANNLARKLFGVESLEQAQISSFIKEDNEYLTLLDAMRNKQRYAGTLTVITSHGTRLCEVYSYISVNNLGTDVQLIFNDITDRVRLQKQLKQYEIIHTYSLIAASFSHDISNIVAAIQGNLELLSTKGAEGSEIEAMKRGLDDINKLLKMMKGAKYQTTDVNVNLKEVINGVYTYARALNSSIQIKVNHEVESPIIHGNFTHLMQIFLNLITNAQETITRKGGSEKRILIHVRVNPDFPKYYCVQIQDTGEGIPKNKIDTIFTPLYSSKKDGIHGIGLSAVKELVAQHKGFIEVESELYVGSEFSVYFPKLEQT